MQIIRCMTYSPRYRALDKEQRWIMASTRIIQEINPLCQMLREKELPLANTLTKRDISENPEIAYQIFLKTLLEQSPSLRVKEVDKKIASALKKMKISEEQIAACLSHSYQLVNIPEKERKQRIQQIMEDQVNIPSQKIKNNENQILYESLQEYLRREKMIQKKHIGKYWRNVHTKIKETMLSVDQAQIAAKILCLWTVGIEKACEDLSIPLDQAVLEMHHQIDELVKSKEMKWEFIFQLAGKASDFADKIVSYLEFLQKETRFQAPKIIQAVPLQNLKPFSDSQSLYYAAVKLVALNLAETADFKSIKETDAMVVKLLKAKKCNYGKIKECLTYSPGLLKIPLMQRRKYIDDIINPILGPQIGLRK